MMLYFVVVVTVGYVVMVVAILVEVLGVVVVVRVEVRVADAVGDEGVVVSINFQTLCKTTVNSTKILP